MPVLKLTQQFIDRELTCPEDKKRIEYCDSSEPPNGVPGLYVLVTATGNITSYYLRYKDPAGKTCHEKIGRTRDISLADARKKAKTLKAEISLGADPRGEEKARKEVLTLTDFFEQHYFPFKTPRKRSVGRDRDLWERIKVIFGQQRLNQIKRQDVQSFHTGLLEQGLAPATCDHHVKLIRHALNLALEWGMIDKNPVVRVPLFNASNTVEHYMDETQLENLLSVLRTDDNRPVCLIAMFLLSTGARLNEALQATWKQVDRENRVWRIPASNSKSKRIRSIPLNDAALDVLAQVETEGKFENIFISKRRGAPIKSIMKVWSRLRNLAGLPHVRLHDLRHQYASFLVNSGRTLFEVQMILGHSDPKVTQRYSHLSSKSLQEAANAASVLINRAMPTPAADGGAEVPAEVQQAAA